MVLDLINIKHSPRARRLALRLDPKDRVINLVVPRGVSMRNAERFAYDHADWIEEKLQELPPAVPFEHGRIIPLLGKSLEILIEQDDAFKRTAIIMTDNHLIVRTNKDDPSGRIERYLRNLAKEKLTEMALAKASDIGKPVASITVRDTKSRWGSCSEDGKLSFSWRLIFAPPLAMDYVVAHEVAHLVHMHHKKSFWVLCRELSIDYLEGEFWMRNHGTELMRFGAV